MPNSESVDSMDTDVLSPSPPTAHFPSLDRDSQSQLAARRLKSCEVLSASQATAYPPRNLYQHGASSTSTVAVGSDTPKSWKSLDLDHPDASASTSGAPSPSGSRPAFRPQRSSSMPAPRYEIKYFGKYHKKKIIKYEIKKSRKNKMFVFVAG